MLEFLNPPLWLTLGVLAGILIHPGLRRVFLANLKRPFEPSQRSLRPAPEIIRGGPAWFHDSNLALRVLFVIMALIVEASGTESL